MARTAIIIGAGITGTLTAARLARAGWQVTVLEAAHVGAGSSSRTAAGIRQQFSTAETVLGMRYSVDFYRRFPEEIGGAHAPIVQNGYLFLLSGDLAGAAARVEVQRAAGLAEVEMLDAAETAARFPWVDLATITGATWCPSDGFLRPETVYNEAAAAARRHGASIVPNAPVQSAVRSGGRLDAVIAGGRTYTGDLFIDATNAWSPRLAHALGATVLPISPLKRYLWFLRRDGSLDEHTLLNMPLVIAPTGEYCRPENGASLLMGYAHDAPPEPDFSYEDQDRVDPEFSHTRGDEGRAFQSWLNLAGHIPALGEFAGFSATTSGFYGTTPDHNPFLGYDPAVPNLLRLAGFSGHGAMFGPFTAAVALALAEAGRDVPEIRVLGRSASLQPFSLGRTFRHAESMVI